MEHVAEQIQAALQEFGQKVELRRGEILVIGCSTSEVLGQHIGTGSSIEVAKALYEPISRFCSESGLYLAVQCCEHLNRALVVSRECLDHYCLPEVSAVPQPKAGGSFAAVAYARTTEPALAESIQGHAGLDIGDTLIGMHLRPVAVPVRLGVKTIGEAHLVAARTRAKLIGGERAVYKQTEGVLKSCL